MRTLLFVAGGVLAGLLVGQRFSSPTASDKLVTPQRIGALVGGAAGFFLSHRM